MLSLSLDRRDFLRVGGITLGGLSFANAIASRAAADSAARLTTDRSVILVFLHGGPSQIETFDPKMGAPAEIRSATGEVQTRIPGVTFGATFSKLAKLADKL